MQSIVHMVVIVPDCLAQCPCQCRSKCQTIAHRDTEMYMGTALTSKTPSVTRQGWAVSQIPTGWCKEHMFFPISQALLVSDSNHGMPTGPHTIFPDRMSLFALLVCFRCWQNGAHCTLHGEILATSTHSEGSTSKVGLELRWKPFHSGTWTWVCLKRRVLLFFLLRILFVFQPGAAFLAICYILELKSVFCMHFGARISHLRAHLAFGFWLWLLLLHLASLGCTWLHLASLGFTLMAFGFWFWFWPFTSLGSWRLLGFSIVVCI